MDSIESIKAPQSFEDVVAKDPIQRTAASNRGPWGLLCWLCAVFGRRPGTVAFQPKWLKA